MEIRDEDLVLIFFPYSRAQVEDPNNFFLSDAFSRKTTLENILKTDPELKKFKETVQEFATRFSLDSYFITEDMVVLSGLKANVLTAEREAELMQDDAFTHSAKEGLFYTVTLKGHEFKSFLLSALAAPRDEDGGTPESSPSH